jgi:hypothetical protein
MKTALIAAVVSAVVTSKNIKNGSIQAIDLSAKAKLALKGSRGARGPAGAEGPQGIQGLQGIQGPPGIQGVRLVVSPLVTIAAGVQGRRRHSVQQARLPWRAVLGWPARMPG